MTDSREDNRKEVLTITMASAVRLWSFGVELMLYPRDKSVLGHSSSIVLDAAGARELGRLLLAAADDHDQQKAPPAS